MDDTRDLEARLRKQAKTRAAAVHGGRVYPEEYAEWEAADALAAQRAEIERLHAEQTRLRSVIEVLTDGGDVRVATDLWQRAKDAEAQLAEAQRQAVPREQWLDGPIATLMHALSDPYMPQVDFRSAVVKATNDALRLADAATGRKP